MLLQRAMIVWAMAATALLVVPAYATDVTPEAPSPAIESSPPSPALEPTALEPAPSVPVEGLPFDARQAGLIYYNVDLAAATPRPNDFRVESAQGPVPETALWLSPVAGASRTGWAASGRVGPLRWLSPIDGEGETTMRLWGRVSGQPRTQGLGTYNISIHYTFE